jgi:AraC family transcriptional regulator
MRTVQVHIPRGTVDASARQLGIRVADFEVMAASLAGGDALIEENIRTLGSLGDADDLHAESAAAFLSMHLLTRHVRSSAPRPPVREDRRSSREPAPGLAAIRCDPRHGRGVERSTESGPPCPAKA